MLKIIVVRNEFGRINDIGYDEKRDEYDAANYVSNWRYASGIVTRSPIGPPIPRLIIMVFGVIILSLLASLSNRFVIV